METRITTRHFRCDAHPGVSTLEPDRRIGRRGNKGSAFCKKKGEAKCDLCRTMNYVDMMQDGVCKHCIDSIQKGF